MSPFEFVLGLVALTFGFIIIVVAIGKKAKPRKGEGLSEDEAQVMKEIHRSLGAMERRVEALETLLINRK